MAREMRTVNKYLKRYAEKEISLLHSFPENIRFNHCIAIPACDEKPDFVLRLKDSALSKNTLLILVVNQSPNANNKMFNANQQLHVALSSASSFIWKNENLQLLKQQELHILLVDRYSPGKEIPEKEGVGRARKLACDLAATLFIKEALHSNWIYSTDADAHLPENYFSHSSENLAAQVFNFEHIGDTGPVLDATLQYEQAIKYYRKQLEVAGSPYAFYTLGSTLAVGIEAYCQVRGFPPRSGGEDFYLLNKLAKVGEIKYLERVCVSIEARLSERVPFGTGPAVASILENNKNGKPYCYYAPQVFVELQTLLQNLNAIWQRIDSNTSNNSHAPTLNNKIVAALTEIGIDNFVTHCKKQGYKQEAFAYQFKVWFDAFRTLKFIHHLQTHYYPATPLQ